MTFGFRSHPSDVENCGRIDLVFWRTERHEEIIKENIIERNATIKALGGEGAAIFMAGNLFMY